MSSQAKPEANAAARQLLVAGAAQLGVALGAGQVDALLAYLALIEKWNKVYNLTAVRDPADMLTHHLLDSLAVIAPLRVRLAATAGATDGATDDAVDGRMDAVAANASDAPAQPGPVFRLLDVGSGAGLPGIVISICCPEIAVDCVDTVAKKAAFINQVAVTLKLPHLRGLHNRVENLTSQNPSEQYDVICSRAFASLGDFTRLSAAALKEGGVWLAMKAKKPTEELAALGPLVEVFHVEQLAVPGLDAERRIVWMRKSA